MHASRINPFELNLDRTAANYVALSPLSMIARTAAVYPNRLAVVHGQYRFTWAQTFARSKRLASALGRIGVGHGDTVAVIATNIPAFYEAFFGIPAAGAVINPINTRLEAASVAFMLEHGGAKVVLSETEFAPLVREAVALCKSKPLIIDIADDDALCQERIGIMEYEEFISSGDPELKWRLPTDEWQALALCYTSGTTGDPKGVVYHHRGAYLNAIGCAMAWNMEHHPVYLWTLPMFHCCGWTFPWTIAVYAGTNVCLRRVAAKPIFDALADHGVTHFCAAPVVLNMIINARSEERRTLNRSVEVMTAAASPPAAILRSMRARGFRVTHVYGLTETYGPAVISAPQDDWSRLDDDAVAEKLARQGVRFHVLEDLQVVDPDTMKPVPRDGKTIGEVMFQGNIVMRGYLKNRKATMDAFDGGYFGSGDLAVVHPDGYLQIKDRSKDIIISGGEKISSIEVEEVLYSHPDVLEAAIVARPDDKWGETPCAFVTLKDVSASAGAPRAAVAAELIAYCRARLAHFKTPKTVVFCELPRTATGKIQKIKLRKEAEAMGSL